MKFFIDTADVDEIREAAELGVKKFLEDWEKVPK